MTAAPSMWPTLILVVLFVVAMLALPWLVRRLQNKNLLPRGMGMARGAAPMQQLVLGSLSIGPQQRVVTVQVGEGHEAVRLVLGVTAQQIQCLHVLQTHAGQAPAANEYVAKPPSFTDSLVRAQAAGSARDSGND